MPALDAVRPRGVRLPRHARRVQLLGAAREVFVEMGYHAAAMDDIAERAGVSKPVLYQHFPGKLELYLALLDEYGDEIVKAVKQALDSTEDNKLRVAATMQAYFDFVDSHGGAFRLVFESDLMNEPAVRERIDRVTQDCAELVSRLITEDAGLPPEESMLLAVGLVGTAQIAARYWVSMEGSIPRDIAADLVATLSWRGIRGFPRRDAG